MTDRSYKITGWNELERSFRVVASTARAIKRFEWNEEAKKFEEYFEALEGWNLTRYEKNPLVLESHNAYAIDAAIGLGSELKETADGGLEMKVTLDTSNRAQELAKKIKDGLVRGISVGFDYGERTDEVRGGRTVRIYRNNVLNEVSLCLIPADEDALVEADTDEETRKRERLTNAGKALASARRPRSDASDDEVNRFDYVGKVGKVERTQIGGIRVPARLTRTGILEYRLNDGTVRRELRLPGEVFNTDSLATLQGAPVTEIEHHRGLISPETWRAATRGHVESIRKEDGKYVGADVIVSDANAIAAVERGDLHDISCGYSCKLDFTPGEYEGQRYDAIQRFIRYNHVAVLPKGRGRAGTDVALRLDAKDAVCVEAEDQQPKEAIMKVIKIDGKELEYGSEAHIAHMDAVLVTERTKWDTERKELVTKCDTLEAKADAAEKGKAKAEKDLEEEKGKADARARSRARLIARALRLLEDEEDEDEKKSDALWEMTDREIMEKVIKADAKYADDDFAKKSDDYVTAIFDSVSKDFTRADGVDNVVKEAEKHKRLDAKDKEGPVEKATRERAERHANMAKGPLHTTRGTN